MTISLEYMRTEFFAGHGVTNRKPRDQWETDGSIDARESARNIAKKILAQQETFYISTELDRWICSKYDIRL